MFTREVTTDYPGYITTSSIMLAAQSISGDSLNDMKVYYKTARGVWVDGLTNLQTTTPDSFKVTMKNLKVFCNPSATIISEAVCMQDMNSSIASSMTTNVDYFLKDNRDGKSYKIAKFADDKVWMKQNLALGGDKEIRLTPEDTNITTAMTLPVSEHESDWPMPRGSGDDPWNCRDDWSCETLRVYAEPSGRYGNFYTWYTATANSGAYSTSGNQVSVEQSICPKGWGLPTGMSTMDSGELTALYNATGATYESFVNATDFNQERIHVDGKMSLNSIWWSKTTASWEIEGKKSASVLASGIFEKDTNPPSILSNTTNFRDNTGIIRCIAR